MKKIVMCGIFVFLMLSVMGCGECKHEFDAGTVTKNPTCAEEGERTYTCSLCQFVKTESVEKVAHTYEEEVTKSPTFKEEGVKTYTCEACGHSYTEAIPVLEDVVIVSVTGKTNLPQDIKAGRFSDRVQLVFSIENETDQAIKGVQGKLTVKDLFGKKILTMNCDFTGEMIPAKGAISVDDLGMDINQFMEEHVKFYNTDFADLQFEYEVTNIVYDNGSGTVDQSEAQAAQESKVSVGVTDKQNLDVDYKAGRFSARVEFTFEVSNFTEKDIKGVQGILTIKDLFDVEIISLGLDFTGQTIAAGSSVVFSDLGFDINEFMEDHVKVYNTDFDNLKFAYEVTAIVYSDGTTE